MAYKLANCVQETSTTTGTGTLTLNGAVVGYASYSNALTDGDSISSRIESVDNNGVPTGDWEVSTGVYSENTLTRASVLSSSNSNSLVDFASGTKRVFVVAPAEELVVVDREQTFNQTQIFASGLTSPQNSNSERFGMGSSAASDGTAVGKNADATGQGSIAIGYGSSAAGQSAVGSIAIGKNANAASDAGGGGSVVIGGNCSSTGSNNVVIGVGQSVSGQSATIIGSANSLTNGSVIVGFVNSVSDFGGICIGSDNTSSHIGGHCFGDLLTTTRTRELVIGHGPTSGSGASTIGFRQRIMAETSTATMRDNAILDATWATSTDASRMARFTAYVCDSTGTDKEGWRIESDGTQPLVSFYGEPAVARQVLATGSSVDDIIIALQNLGLVKQS